MATNYRDYLDADVASSRINNSRALGYNVAGGGGQYYIDPATGQSGNRLIGVTYDQYGRPNVGPQGSQTNPFFNAGSRGAYAGWSGGGGGTLGSEGPNPHWTIRNTRNPYAADLLGGLYGDAAAAKKQSSGLLSDYLKNAAAENQFSGQQLGVERAGISDIYGGKSLADQQNLIQDYVNASRGVARYNQGLATRASSLGQMPSAAGGSSYLTRMLYDAQNAAMLPVEQEAARLRLGAYQGDQATRLGLMGRYGALGQQYLNSTLTPIDAINRNFQANAANVSALSPLYESAYFTGLGKAGTDGTFGSYSESAAADRQNAQIAAQQSAQASNERIAQMQQQRPQQRGNQPGVPPPLISQDEAKGLWKDYINQGMTYHRDANQNLIWTDPQGNTYGTNVQTGALIPISKQGVTPMDDPSAYYGFPPQAAPDAPADASYPSGTLGYPTMNNLGDFYGDYARLNNPSEAYQYRSAPGEVGIPEFKAAAEGPNYGGYKSALVESVARTLGIPQNAPMLQIGGSALYQDPREYVRQQLYTRNTDIGNWFNNLPAGEKDALLRSAMVGGAYTNPSWTMSKRYPPNRPSSLPSFE